MGGQGPVDLGHQTIGQSTLPELYDGVEVVRRPPEASFVRPRQGKLRGWGRKAR